MFVAILQINSGINYCIFNLIPCIFLLLNFRWFFSKPGDLTIWPFCFLTETLRGKKSTNGQTDGRFYGVGTFLNLEKTGDLTVNTWSNNLMGGLFVSDYQYAKKSIDGTLLSVRLQSVAHSFYQESRDGIQLVLTYRMLEMRLTKEFEIFVTHHWFNKLAK